MAAMAANSQNSGKLENDDNSQISGKARFDSKGWFLTYSQCPLEPSVVLQYIEKIVKVKEYVVAQEEHKDGGKHLHAFIKTEKKITWRPATQARKWDIVVSDDEKYHPHVETARSWHAVEEYCKKEGNYITNIDLDAARSKKAARNKQLIEANPKEAIETGLIGFCALPQFLKAKRAFRLLEKPDKVIPRQCYWIWGKPRIGKSYLVRQAFEDIYEKSQNKWWDGYEGEEVVLIDDLDKQASCLSHYLKIWADNYRFNAEIKGDTIFPRYTKLIVTSNYLPEEIFEGDYELLEAIRGRFTVINMADREEQEKIINLIK